MNNSDWLEMAVLESMLKKHKKIIQFYMSVNRFDYANRYAIEYLEMSRELYLLKSKSEKKIFWQKDGF